MTCSQIEFSEIARRLQFAARELGLSEVPAFRSPPHVRGQNRTIRRCKDQVVVAVRRDRDVNPVAHDMIDGVIAANQLDGDIETLVREKLWAAATEAIAA